MDLTEINTLKITFPDDTSTMFQKWFTDQFEYFKNIIDDLGEDKSADDGSDYKYFEIDLRTNAELGKLLTKNVLSFLKRYAYHTYFVSGRAKTADDDNWHATDSFQFDMISKYLTEGNVEELFQIFVASNYLGYAPLCHSVTDELIKRISVNGMDMNNIISVFKLEPSDYNTDEQKLIMKKFEWQ